VAESSPAPAVVSASEANRSFSALLRAVARGQTFTVLSHGRAVATLTPVSPGPDGMGACRRVLLARLTDADVVVPVQYLGGLFRVLTAKARRLARREGGQSLAAAQ
jgi:prevent-host-death family protein